MAKREIKSVNREIKKEALAHRAERLRRDLEEIKRTDKKLWEEVRELLR